MKKISRGLLFLGIIALLTVVFGGTAFAADGTENTRTTGEWINASIIYAVFALALVVGLPVMKKMSKRTKVDLTANLVGQALQIAEKVENFYVRRDTKFSQREAVKLSIQISMFADKVLSAHTENKIEGYLDVYNALKEIKDKLLSLDRKNENFDDVFADVNASVKSAVEQMKFLSDREKKISNYKG